MHIVAIISSARRSGNSAILTRQVLQGAQDNGASVEELFLYDHAIDFCKGCLACLAKGKCDIDDDFEWIKNKLKQADGIVLSAPCYGLAPNAKMKCFIDRIGMLNAYTSSLGGKYTITISTAAAIGAKKVARTLAELIGNGAFQRGYVTGILAVKTGWNNTCKDPFILEHAYKLGEKLVSDIRIKRCYPLQNLRARMINWLVVRRMFEKNILSHKNDGMHAVYENLSARGLLRIKGR